jgi:tetratricopeptide (TPR) repeat protein
MKNKLILLSTLLTFGIVGWAFLVPEKKEVVQLQEDTVIKKVAAVKRAPLLNHEVVNKILKKTQKKGLGIAKRNFPSNKTCPNLIENLKGFDQDLSINEDLPFLNLKDCPNLSHYGEAFKTFKKACGDLNLIKNKRQKLFCGHALFMLKAQHAELLTEGLKIDDIDDIENLIYKYFFRLFGPGKRDSLLQISERVLDLEPELSEFKVLGLISYFEAMVSKRKNLFPEQLERMEQHFDDLLQDKDAKGREGLYELRLLTMMHSEKNRSSEIAEFLTMMEEELPQSGLSDYYRASLSHKQQNNKEALKHLKRAIQKSPKTGRFNHTYQTLLKADKAKTRSNPFIFQLSFKGLPFDSM